MTHWPKTGCSVLVYSEGKVLLIKRGKNPLKDHWSLPGGTHEAGETLESCAQRELTEETGLVAQSMQFAIVRDRIGYLDNGDLSHHFVLTTFLCSEFSGRPVAGDDASDIGWFSMPEMQALRTTPDTPELIEQLINHHFA